MHSTRRRRLTGSISRFETWIALVVLVLVLLSSCRKSWEVESQKVWTIGELKGLQGKSRDEIREILGKPNGLYTYDSKGRWHYPNILVSSEGAGEPKRMTVMIYFSQLGEHRSTIIDVLERFEE